MSETPTYDINTIGEAVQWLDEHVGEFGRGEGPLFFAIMEGTIQQKADLLTDKAQFNVPALQERIKESSYLMSLVEKTRGRLVVVPTSGRAHQ